ncbi:MAG TPA: hypothetical protein VNT25_06670 [Allosphingosinicella sp.]|nr:hypothetical protein [Allosphingosinicella sp.]
MASRKSGGSKGGPAARTAAPKKNGKAQAKKPKANLIDEVPPAPRAEVPDEQPVKEPEPTQAASPTIKIFQIWYEPLQRELIDPAFIPLDNRGTPSEYLEFDMFNRLFLSEHVKDADLWGALSWRFTEKTGLTGADLLKVIEDNPGHDVYFCNPYPKHEALFHNLWVQGETAHPRFLELVRAFLTAAGLPVEDTEMLWPSSIYSSANYFVGTPRFWQAYLSFITGAIRGAEQSLPQDIKDALHSTAADDRNLHGGSSYMPFIVERLFPLFLRTGGRGLKALKVPLPVLENELDVHLRLLRQMKDAAHSGKSAWLGACWANYRSLYFAQLHGQEWTRKYLRAVTPTEFKFG